MAVDVVRVLTLVGVMVVGGVVASLAFKRTGIPDILFLIGHGVLLGSPASVARVPRPRMPTLSLTADARGRRERP